MDFLQKWYKDILLRAPITLPHTIRSVGERIADLGPRSDFARVTLRFDPFEKFSVALDQLPDDIIVRRFAIFSVFGAIDVLMTALKYPISGVLITVEHLDIDSIKSNEMAFRLAGRSAARSALVDAKMLIE